MTLRSLFLIFLMGLFLRVVSQTTYPENGVNNPTYDHFAFVNANIWVSADDFVSNATLIVRNGKVVKSGKNIEIPEDAIKIDLKGKYIYPSFIDLYSNYGMPVVKKKKSDGRRVQLDSKEKQAGNWNEQIHPESRAFESFAPVEKDASALREMGFGVVLTHQHDGIMRGSSVLVSLGNKKTNELIVAEQSTQQIAFQRGQSLQVYPTSLMGMIALIRQTYYDAIWYENDKEKREINPSLGALSETKDLPVVFDVISGSSIPRAIKVGKEFERNIILKGTTDSYLYSKDLSESNIPIILPINFPSTKAVAAPFDQLNISLADLKHWESAPHGPKILFDNGVQFCFTQNGLNKKSNFLIALRKMKRCGIPEKEIIRGLTMNPAAFINQDEILGDLSTGKRANFFISSSSIFEKEAVILENWVEGKRYVVKREELDVRGTYNLNVNKEAFVLNVTGERFKPKALVAYKNEKIKVDLDINDRSIELSFVIPEKSGKRYFKLSGVINDDESRIWAGKAVNAQGKWVDWAAIRQSEKSSKKDTSKIDIIPTPQIWYPNRAFGFDSLPGSEVVIFQNATIWTNEDTGILENSDIAISDGKILAIGANITRVGLFGSKDVEVKTINAKGKHITCGIIDEHSHIAIDRGVNEAGWNNSAEVSIGDVIRANDVNIYRQLMGGVTAAQLLHGSANPIGGRSALVKLRWGKSAEELKIEGADAFIKFALGENVKQSNWGDNRKTRFPQTRMGVEQVYFDAFYQAREYSDTWEIHERAVDNKKRRDVIIPPRRNLRLEALSQILDTTRFITCHSYVQSEINMLMHVGDSMGFQVNTFTHVLEGYKVADKIKKHGAGASTFSDWWAYKFEVNDAIPYNAAILNEQNVVTAINSDDAEMGRRLNHEAAKTVKYGGVSQEDAWKMVTLNPAILLHLDDRMGSLREGKDADIVLWSGNPLSINSKVEQTYIDGVCYFDRLRHDKLMERDRLEKERIIHLMMKEAHNQKEKPKKPEVKIEHVDHCDTILTEDI